jgi:hypothetical protein
MATLTTRLAAAIPLRPNRTIRFLGFGLFALAVLSCGLGLAAFSQDSTAAKGWLPYLSSAAFFMAACYLIVPYRPAFVIPDRLTRTTLVSLLFILAVGLFLRLYRLDVQPFGIWSDEVDIGAIANRILNNPEFRPFIVPDNQTPLHFFALVAWSFQLLGKSIIAIRVVTVSLGTASIGLAFLAGREAFGNRFGLLFAFAVAVAHWHVNFSRFGVYTMSVSFFGLLAIWFLLRARRTRQLHDFVWAGLALGFGLNFYIAARLLVVVLFIYLGYEVLLACWHRLAPAGIKPYPRSTLAVGLVALLAAVWFSIAPLIQYSVTYPDLYWGRSNDVSIFTHRDEPDLATAIYKNTVTHLLMFNYHGDNNGRHNLPGEPMLDPAMGVLFVLGVGLAVARFRNPVNLLMLVLFGVGLMGGILSLDFEAPQSTRAFNAIIPVLYFVALTVETLWRGVDHLTLSPAARRLTVITATLALGSYVIYYNAETYFVRQANNDRVWYEYNGIETTAAYRMQEAFAAGSSIYGSVYLNNHIVIQFLAPEIVGTQTLVPPVGFPLSEAGDRPVTILVDPSSLWILDQIKLYYPNAQTRIDTAPSGSPALYTVTIPASDIQRLQGVSAQYWAGDTPAGEADSNRVENNLAADWPAAAPVAAPFVAQWDSTLVAPRYGPYEFNLQTPADATLWLDNQPLISGSGDQTARSTLAAGPHTVRLQAAGDSGPVQLTWRQPDANGELSAGEFEPIPDWRLLQPKLAPVRGLLGTYYNGETETTPVFTRIDAFLDMYIHYTPLPRPYTVDWTGQIDIPVAGDWTFGLDVNGQAELAIDDQTVINTTANDQREGHLSLTTGPHRLRLHFLDNTGGSFIHLYWTAPNGEKQIVPTTALEPLP